MLNINSSDEDSKFLLNCGRVCSYLILRGMLFNDVRVKNILPKAFFHILKVISYNAVSRIAVWFRRYFEENVSQRLPGHILFIILYVMAV